MNKFKKFALAGAVESPRYFSFLYNFLIIPLSSILRKSQSIHQSTNDSPARDKSGLTPPAIDKEKIVDAYGKLPLHFEPNLGQTDEQVKFLARGHGYSLFLTEKEAVLSLQKRGKNKTQDKRAVVRMQIEGANDAPKVNRSGRNRKQIELFYRQRFRQMANRRSELLKSQIRTGL